MISSEMPKKPKIQVGDAHERLTVLKVGVGNVKVRCACGVKKRILITNFYKTKSCGCLKRETDGKASTTHGMAGTPTYQSWRDMLNRCYRKKTKRWDRYGGRGIAVCKKWRNSFEAFLADVGPRPSPAHTIGRIDNDGNYEPGNVEWQTLEQQAQNKSSARLITWNGQTKNAIVWARELDMPYHAFLSRLRRGWPLERMMTEPLRSYGYDLPLMDQIQSHAAAGSLGETFTASIVADHLGDVTQQSVQHALKKLATRGLLRRVQHGVYAP